MPAIFGDAHAKRALRVTENTTHKKKKDSLVLISDSNCQRARAVITRRRQLNDRSSVLSIRSGPRRSGGSEEGGGPFGHIVRPHNPYWPA